MDNFLNLEIMSEMIITRLGEVGCKTILRLVERAIAVATVTKKQQQQSESKDVSVTILVALEEILDDFVKDDVTAQKSCVVNNGFTH